MAKFPISKAQEFAKINTTYYAQGGPTMFKPTSKAAVINAVKKFYGRELTEKCKVNGERLEDAECKRRGYPRGTYFVELVVGGEQVATARSLDWRKSYKYLVCEIEKLYADGKELTNHG